MMNLTILRYRFYFSVVSPVRRFFLPVYAALCGIAFGIKAFAILIFRGHDAMHRYREDVICGLNREYSELEKKHMELTRKINERTNKIMTEQPATECVICGGHIPAGKYPPVCGDACRNEYNIEVDFNKIAREEIERAKSRRNRPKE